MEGSQLFYKKNYAKEVTANLPRTQGLFLLKFCFRIPIPIPIPFLPINSKYITLRIITIYSIITG